MMSDPLPTDIKELQRLLLESRRNAELAQRQVSELSATVAAQRDTIDEQERAIADLLAALRGKKRERIDPDQLLLFELGELESVLQERDAEEPPVKRRRRRQSGRLIPDHVPHEEVLHELDPDQRRCPHDGQPMPLIRYEISKQLEYQPPRLKVLVHKRAVYACPEKHDEAVLLTAPKPPQPIEKGLAGPGLLAALVVGKFGDHLPGYRLEDIFARHGVPLRRSTIFDWLAAVADLSRPLVTRMKDLLLASTVIHTDDTQVKLIDAELRSTRTARFWAYIGDRSHPYTVYDFTETRQRDGPQGFLNGYRGYLQADAYGGYDGLYLPAGGTILEVACWTHCRRYWWKAREQDPPRAHYVLALIGRLYEIERAAKDLTSEERQSLRTEHTKPLLEELRRWLDEQQLLPKSLIGQAATYTRNQWQALARYVEDGSLSIDNNLSERTVKPIAIGRKNWLFVGSIPAGQRAAVLMSLVASCKANRVEPWAYLQDVFTQLPRGADLDSLLPDRWLATHPQHRWAIADRRDEERTAKGGI